MGALQHTGVRAGGEPGGLAHLFDPGPRRDGPSLVEAPREKQREGLVHGGLLHLHRGAHPARGPGTAVQAQDPVERDDASLVTIEPSRSRVSCCRVSRSRPASSVPRRGSRIA